MVSVKKKKINGKVYYYLSYSYRKGNKVQFIEKEIGKEILGNLDELKEKFIKKIVDKRWVKEVDLIKGKYVDVLKNMPNIGKAKYFKNFGVKFTYHSNKIEGSTLTLIETALAIEEKEVPINKPTNQVNEAQFHMMVYEDMINTKSELSFDLISEWHRTLFTLHPDQNNFAGLIRKVRIYISRSNYQPPLGGIVCETLLNDLFKWYNENKDSTHPVLLACLMHFQFVSIHPFLDGNGRMSRMLMNYILHHNNYPMFDIPFNIRQSYYNALEKANLKEDDMRFVGWFFKNYLKYMNGLSLNELKG